MVLTPMTDEEIAELRKLHEAGIAPPWSNMVFDGPEYFAGVVGPDGKAIIKDAHPDQLQPIAEARNALPRLLDFAERARKLLGEMEWKDGRCLECGAIYPGPHEFGCDLAAPIGKP